MKTSFIFKSVSAAFLLITVAIPAVYAQVATPPTPNQPDNVKFNPRDTEANPQHPPVLPDSRIVAPSAPNWKIPVNPARQFDRYILPPPPTNTSTQTKLELDELNQLAATRSNPNVVTTITRWNFDPPGSNYNLYFDYLIQKYRYSPPLAARCEAMLNEGVYSGLLAAWYNKFMYLRPRPDQVTGYAFQSLVNPAVENGPTLPTPYHPAYPSGHSTSAGVFMAIGPACFPNEPVESFVNLGREASLSRRQGGVHYYSDSVAGEALGYTVGSAIVRAYNTDSSPLGGNTAPDVYSRPPSFNSDGTPQTTLQQKQPTITQRPDLSNDRSRIILLPLQTKTPFPTPTLPVPTPPAPIVIPAASTIILGPQSTPVNPTSPGRRAPASFSDPDPAPSQSGATNSAAPLPSSSLLNVDAAPTNKQ